MRGVNKKLAIATHKINISDGSRVVLRVDIPLLIKRFERLMMTNVNPKK
jgi:hypothetical protein